MIYGWLNMRRHLVEIHRENGAYLRDADVDKHYTGPRPPTTHYSLPYNPIPMPQNNINMNTTEFTDVLSNMTNLISTNIQQGIGTTLNAAAFFSNMSNNTRSQYPMKQPHDYDAHQQQSIERNKYVGHRPQLMERKRPKPAAVTCRNYESKPPSVIRAIRDVPIVISDTDSDDEGKKIKSIK